MTEYSKEQIKQWLAAYRKRCLRRRFHDLPWETSQRTRWRDYTRYGRRDLIRAVRTCEDCHTTRTDILVAGSLELLARSYVRPWAKDTDVKRPPANEVLQDIWTDLGWSTRL